MGTPADNALIVQSDSSVLLDVHAPRAEGARQALAPFADLVKSPEHVHTYRLTPLSIWNARSTGLSGVAMVAALCEHTRYPVPDNVVVQIGELAARYGRVVLTKDGDALVCTCLDRPTAERLARDQAAGPYLDDRIDHSRFAGKSNFNLLKSVTVWLKVVTGFSVIPLRMAMIVGGVMSVSSFLLALYYTLETLILARQPAGYPSLIVSVLFIGGVQLMGIGAVGEYVGRMFITQNNRPQFTVKEIRRGRERGPTPPSAAEV